MISESIQVILLFGILGCVTNYFAWKKGFYQFSSVPASPLQLHQLVSVFAIYIGATYFLAPYLLMLLLKLSPQKPPTYAMILTIQFFIVLAMIAALLAYCLSQGREVFAKIWKSQKSSSAFADLCIGALTCVLAFPIVAIVEQLCTLLLYLIFGFENYEQVAVRYLKSALQSPSQLTLALVSILIIAPLIEEFLFRGTLQTYLKKWLGAKAAILITAACFAFFHYSGTQGLGNLSLIPALFTFACFLGFIYEKQGSLWASIGLHLTFNLTSTIRIVFFPES